MTSSTNTFCPPPGIRTALASLPAPAEVSQGAASMATQRDAFHARQAAAIERNRAAWMSIADFLVRQNLRMCLERRIKGLGVDR